MSHRIAFVALLQICCLALADGPADNIAANVRRIPKLGIEVPADRKAKLEAGLKQLDEKITTLKSKKDAKTAELLPDVEIYFKAVHDALAYQEFFDPRELDAADRVLAAGLERAGHKLTVVTDANALAPALREKHFDVVIAAFDAVDTVATATADAGDASGKPVLLPVVARGDRNSPQVRGRFGSYLVDGASLGQYLQMISKSLPANAL